MSGQQDTYQQLLPQLFRLEYTKMTAVLCRHFGLKHLAVAEDIASEAFLQATHTWAHKGIPENPTAWLYTVAKNKARDYLKHEQIFEQKVSPQLQANNQVSYPDFDFTEKQIADCQLAMIFAVCDPVNPPAAQIALALQILCGFSVTTISHAFLSPAETIKKRLQRARKQLREQNFQVSNLTPELLSTRLPAVHTTLYLLFNEGYFSSGANQVIRQDLCGEALRLAFILTTNERTDTPATKALIALFCYQSSRLEARLNDSGEQILFEQQDTSRWNQELIVKGHQYFIDACTGNELSRYHLEAGIAYWHTTVDNPDKWKHILSLYNELIIISYSPVTALNRTFAFAKVYGNKAGIEEALKLRLDNNSYYHSLLGYLYSDATETAIYHYQKALALTNSEPEKHTIQKEINRLQGL